MCSDIKELQYNLYAIIYLTEKIKLCKWLQLLSHNYEFSLLWRETALEFRLASFKKIELPLFYKFRVINRYFYLDEFWCLQAIETAFRTLGNLRLLRKCLLSSFISVSSDFLLILLHFPEDPLPHIHLHSLGTPSLEGNPGSPTVSHCQTQSLLLHISNPLCHPLSCNNILCQESHSHHTCLASWVVNINQRTSIHASTHPTKKRLDSYPKKHIQVIIQDTLISGQRYKH